MKRIAWVTALLLSLILCLSVPALAAEDAEAGESAAPAGTEEGLPAPQANEARSGSCGENTTWNLDSEGTMTISGTGSMNDYTGSSEAPWGLALRREIKRVVISNGVTNVGDYAFSGCDYLKDVSLPSSLERIGIQAFFGCGNLEAVTFPTYQTDADLCKLKSIGNNAFFGCKKMARMDIDICYELESIGESAFYSCEALANVTLDDCDELDSVGDHAFYRCTSLRRISLCDPSYIGSGAFSECESLETFLLGSTGNKSKLRKIEDFTFSFCEKLDFVYLPEEVESIGDYAFASCKNLPLMPLSRVYKITSIGKGAFSNCTNLQNEFDEYQQLPDGLTFIGDEAFNGCSKLIGELDLPSGLTSIGNSAFRGCSGLTNVRFPDTLTFIGESAFRDCTNITGKAYESIVIPGGVKNIADYTFYGCSNLIWLEIAEGVESIGECAFYNCSQLAGGPFIIPDGVTSIGDSAFYQAGCLSYKIPGSLTSIGGGVFDQGTQWLEYGGTESQWRGVQGYDNSPLNRFMSDGRIHYSTTPYPIPVSSVSITPTSAAVMVTSTVTLTANISPANAMDKTVTWSSDNPSVATVDSGGKVKGLREGTAVITVNASGKTCTCEIRVIPVPDYGYTSGDLSLEAGAVDLIPGMSDDDMVMRARFYITASLKDPQIWWRILDPDIALLSNRASAFGEQAGEIYTPVTGIQDPAILIHPKNYGTTFVIARPLQAFTPGNYSGAGNPVAFTLTVHRPEEMVKVQPKLSIGVGQTKTIRVELAVKGLSTTGTGWEYGTLETSDCMVKILKTEKEEDSNNILLTVQGVKAGQTSLGPCMLYDGKVVAATAKDCAVTVTQTPAAPTYSMGPGGEVTVKREGRRINVLTGPVSGKQPLWAASYDPRGKLISLQKLTSPAASATVPAGAGRCKLMWLDEKSAPKCGNLEFTF